MVSPYSYETWDGSSRDSHGTDFSQADNTSGELNWTGTQQLPMHIVFQQDIQIQTHVFTNPLNKYCCLINEEGWWILLGGWIWKEHCQFFCPSIKIDRYIDICTGEKWPKKIIGQREKLNAHVYFYIGIKSHPQTINEYALIMYISFIYSTMLPSYHW